MISLFSAALFAQLGKDQQGVQNITGFLFSCSMLFSFMPSNGVILLFPSERSVFLREYAKGMYHPGLYYLSKNVIETPIQMMYSACSIAVSYYIVGLRTEPGYFFMTLLVYVTISLVGASIGMIVGAAVQDVGKAMELGPSVIIPQMLVAGLFFTTETMRSYLVWFEKISYLRWAFESLMITQFKDAKLDCSAIAPNCSGNDVLKYYGFKHEFVETYFILFSMLLIYRFIGYVALHFSAYKSTSE